MQDALTVPSIIGDFELTYSRTIAETYHAKSQDWMGDKKLPTGKGIPVLSVDIKETVTINRVDYDQIYFELLVVGSPGDCKLERPDSQLYYNVLTTSPLIKRSDTGTCYESKISDSARAKINAAIDAMVAGLPGCLKDGLDMCGLISAGLKKECDKIKAKAAKVEELFLSLAQIAEQVPHNYRAPVDMTDERADFIVNHEDLLRDMTNNDVTGKALRAARKLPDAPPALLATLHELEGLN